ncbi:MAG: hypothetical protein ACTTK5_01440 [Candidatus Fimenecus sp.]
MNICEEGARNLANGIITQAAEDYKAAFLGNTVDKKPPKKAMKSIESFFHSEYYRNLTDVDADWLIQNLKSNALEDVITKLDRFVKSENKASSITLKIPKSKEQEPMTFIIPPKFKPEFTAFMRRLKMAIAAEREEIIKKDYMQGSAKK